MRLTILRGWGSAVDRLIGWTYQYPLFGGKYRSQLSQATSLPEDVPTYAYRTVFVSSLVFILLTLVAVDIAIDAVFSGISEALYDFRQVWPQIVAGDMVSALSTVAYPLLILLLIPGIIAVIHSRRVNRLLAAGDVLKARQASNFAETWTRVAIFTIAGLLTVWVVFLVMSLLAALALVLVILAVIIGALLIIFRVLVGLNTANGTAGSYSSSSSSYSSSSSDRSSSSSSSDRSSSSGSSNSSSDNVVSGGAFQAGQRAQAARRGGGQRGGGGRGGGGRGGGGGGGGGRGR